MKVVLLLSALALFGSACAGPGAAKAKDIPGDETALARKLYVAKCAKCHKLYPPANYSDEEWRMWVGKMSKKARLKPEQQRILSDYIELALRHPARH